MSQVFLSRYRFFLSLLNCVLLYFVSIVVIFEALNPSVPSLPYGYS